MMDERTGEYGDEDWIRRSEASKGGRSALLLVVVAEKCAIQNYTLRHDTRGGGGGGGGVGAGAVGREGCMHA